MLSTRLKRRARFSLATNDAFERGVRATPPVLEHARRSAQRYVAGADADAALAVSRRLAAAGLHASLDLFGERADAAEADAATAAYAALCARLGAEAPPGTWLSLDLSHLAFDPRRLDRVAAALPDGARLQIGAEEAATTALVLDLVCDAAAAGHAVEATVQANLRRSAADAERLAAAGVPVRLVKGAYVEAPEVALRWGAETDDAYAALAHALHAAGAGVALATHDAALRGRLLRALPGVRHELLLGVAAPSALGLAAAGCHVRIYVPYGDGWFRYLMRRRAEAQGA